MLYEDCRKKLRRFIMVTNYSILFHYLCFLHHTLLGCIFLQNTTFCSTSWGNGVIHFTDKSWCRNCQQVITLASPWYAFLIDTILKQNTDISSRHGIYSSTEMSICASTKSSCICIYLQICFIRICPHWSEEIAVAMYPNTVLCNHSITWLSMAYTFLPSCTRIFIWVLTLP